MTIATKTFLRPHKLMTMLRSVREYYPDLTVIVADDSKEPLKINDNHVEYYIMPFGKVCPPSQRGDTWAPESGSTLDGAASVASPRKQGPGWERVGFSRESPCWRQIHREVRPRSLCCINGAIHLPFLTLGVEVD